MALKDELDMMDVRFDSKIGKAFRNLNEVVSEYFPTIIDDYISGYYWGINPKSVLNTIIRVIHNYDLICVADDDKKDKNGIIGYKTYLDEKIVKALNKVKKEIINEH